MESIRIFGKSLQVIGYLYEVGDLIRQPFTQTANN